MFTITNPAEVEHRLEQLITKHKAKNISVTEIKQRIYETDGEDVMRASNLFQKWWINCFRRIDKDGLEELLQIFQDAWNSFPHRSLGGKSPQQMVQEEMEKHPERTKKSRNDPMPDVTVGGVTLPWNEYWEMLKDMEKHQKPFKQWIEKTALPAYRKFLGTKFKTKKSIEKHYDVADHFFQRALHVGFLDFEHIRPAFAVWEFPDWWPDHVLYSDLNEDQVWSSLCDLLWFAEFVLHRSIPGIWEAAAEEEADFSPNDRVIPPPCEPISSVKTGRNDPCPCGATKPDGRSVKYKHCHGR